MHKASGDTDKYCCASNTQSQPPFNCVDFSFYVSPTVVEVRLDVYKHIIHTIYTPMPADMRKYMHRCVNAYILKYILVQAYTCDDFVKTHPSTIHPCTHTHTHTCTHSQTHVPIACDCVCVRVCVCVFVDGSMSFYMPVQAYSLQYVCMYVCMHAYSYVGRWRRVHCS